MSLLFIVNDLSIDVYIRVVNISFVLKAESNFSVFHLSIDTTLPKTFPIVELKIF